MPRRQTDDQVKVQVLVPRQLRDAIELHAHHLGFDSLQDFTRVLYKTVLNEQLRFSLLSPTNQIAGTHITENDFKEYQRNKLSKYLNSIKIDVDEYQ